VAGPRRRQRARPPGLATLRRGGAVSDLLFLYECTTRDVGQLKDVASALGLSVQAASHTFRGLVRRGLAHSRSGRYRPTVAGVDFLHGTLRGLEADLAQRRERLHFVDSTRAIARTAVSAGAPVVLSIEEGLLTARAGSRGASRGFARGKARVGELVEVERLEGIVPLPVASVELLTVPEDRLAEPATVRALASALRRRPGALVAAHGLESFHLARRAVPDRSIVRFGIPSVVEEASRVGVPSVIVVLDREAPGLLAQFGGSASPRLELISLRPRRG